jgi:hypothetical protein
MCRYILPRAPWNTEEIAEAKKKQTFTGEAMEEDKSDSSP